MFFYKKCILSRTVDDEIKLSYDKQTNLNLLYEKATMFFHRKYILSRTVDDEIKLSPVDVGTGKHWD